MNKAAAQGLLSGIQFFPEGPIIHHLLFGDDTLFLLKAEASSVAVVMEILGIYEAATAQAISLEKSSVIFGAKMELESREEVQNILGITRIGGDEKYLGLPEAFSGSKIKCLSFLQESLKDKLSGYQARLMSQGGKEVIIKSVAMSMSVYAMSVYQLPKSTADNIVSALSNFWWNSDQEKKKIHWVSWDKMCLPKHLGGVGFKDIKIFNQTLLAKQAWRLLQFPDSLIAKIIKSRYYPHCAFLDATLGPSPSFVWRSILFGRELLVKGIRNMVGNGESIKVWTKRWLYDGQRRAPLMKNTFVDLELKVSDILDQRAKWWDIDKINDLFYPEDVERIIKMKPVVEDEDFWCWVHNKMGSTLSDRATGWDAKSIGKTPIKKLEGYHLLTC